MEWRCLRGGPVMLEDAESTLVGAGGGSPLPPPPPSPEPSATSSLLPLPRPTNCRSHLVQRQEVLTKMTRLALGRRLAQAWVKGGQEGGGPGGADLFPSFPLASPGFEHKITVQASPNLDRQKGLGTHKASPPGSPGLIPRLRAIRCESWRPPGLGREGKDSPALQTPACWAAGETKEARHP